MTGDRAVEEGRAEPLVHLDGGLRWRPRPVRPGWGLAELFLLWLLYMYGLWILGPRIAGGAGNILLYWLIVFLGLTHIFATSPLLLHGDPPGLRGWSYRLGRRTDPGALHEAWRAYLGFSLAAAAAMLSYVLVTDPGALAQVDWGRAGLKLGGYLVFGPLQALIFFGFAETRLRVLLGDGRRGLLLTAAATALIFASVHLPNLPLTALTLVGGFGWALIFYRRPNVLLLGLSHALLGTLVHEVIGLNTRIGPFYANGDGYILRSVIPGLKELLGGSF